MSTGGAPLPPVQYPTAPAKITLVRGQLRHQDAPRRREDPTRRNPLASGRYLPYLCTGTKLSGLQPARRGAAWSQVPLSPTKVCVGGPNQLWRNVHMVAGEGLCHQVNEAVTGIYN